MLFSPFQESNLAALTRYRLTCSPHFPKLLDYPLQLVHWRQKIALAVECFSKTNAWAVWSQRQLLAAIATEQRLASGIIAFVQSEPFTPFFQAEKMMSSQLLCLPEDGFKFMQRARDEGKSWGGVDVYLNRLMYCDEKITDTSGRDVIEMMTVAQDMNALWQPGPYQNLMRRLNQSMDGILRNEVYESLTWVREEAGWIRVPQYYQAKEIRLINMFENRLFRFTLGVEKIEAPRNQPST